MENKGNPIEEFAKEYYGNGYIVGGRRMPIKDKMASMLAADSGVTYATVHKAIRGLYTDIPSKLVSFLVKNSDKKAAEWQAEYHEWVSKQVLQLGLEIKAGRLPVGEVFFEAPENLSKSFPDFISWRKAISNSQMEFCRMLFLHQGIINKYENNLMKNIPESLYSRVFGIVSIVTGDNTRALRYAKELAKLPVSSSGKY